MKILNDIANEHDRKTIIFVETKRRADEITRNVNRRGFKAVSIHGDKSQTDRDQTLNAFRSGRMNIQILVATDVASRGLGESSMFLLRSISRLLSVRYSNGRDLSLSVSPQKKNTNKTVVPKNYFWCPRNYFAFLQDFFTSWGRLCVMNDLSLRTVVEKVSLASTNQSRKSLSSRRIRIWFRIRCLCQIFATSLMIFL